MASAKDFRELSDEELIRRADEMEQRLLKYRFQRALAQLEKPLLMRNLKRDYARIMTIIREREIASQKEKQ